jgi:uncharacterized DUF497 family protein
MIFVWDEAKRLSNLAKHGLDFSDIEIHFNWESAALTPARMKRIKAVGQLKSEIAVVIFALLGNEALSLISARKASKRERKAFNDQTHEEL